MSPLQLYNTHTRAKQTFGPDDPSGQVVLFVRGPTVYDLPHLGHAKTSTQLDFLVRHLRARGFAVTYAQNITDADEEIIRRARELRIDASDLARVYERAYFDDTRALRNDSVDVYVRAGDCVEQVISPAERLSGACGSRTGLVTMSDPEALTSLGNFVTIRDALTTASARAIRFAFFSSHYRSPMELTDETFSRAARALARLDRFVEGDGRNAGIGDPGRLHDTRAAIDAALDDDFDTPRALAVLFDLVREQNGYGTRKPHARALVRDFLATFALDAAPE